MAAFKLWQDEEHIPDELEFIERITNLLDSRYKIPLTNIRFGLDPIIGLIPYFGEVVSFSISGILVLSMVRHGASGKLISKMLLNLLIDAVTGLVPGLGDLFDVFFKANRRNYKLLLEHQAYGRHQGTAWPVVIGVGFIILIMLACMIWGMIEVAQWIIGLF